MKIIFDSQPLEINPSGDNYVATMDGKTTSVQVIRAENGKLDLLIDNQRVTAYVSSDGTKRWVTINGQTIVLTKSSGAKKKNAEHDHASELAAPMPGLVRSVNVVEGETVKKGQTLMVVEAMKMEIRIQTKSDGVVKKLFVKQGQIVEREQALIEIE